MSIDTFINDAFTPVAKAVSDVVMYAAPLTDDPDGPKVRLIVVWLALGAVFFSFYLRFVSILHFRHGWRLITGRHKEDNHDTAPGELSNFQAISTCLSGTVGLGNIAGVAVAISLGGPGAALPIKFRAMPQKCVLICFVNITPRACQRPRLWGLPIFANGPIHFFGHTR